MKLDELQTLFGHEKMKRYAANPKNAHYYWLPLIGLYTGARINEICQLNLAADVILDRETKIHYSHFTDETEPSQSQSRQIHLAYVL
ncbi:MAG: hypothetical protein ACXWTP_04405 [Methylosarcina sp.]